MKMNLEKIRGDNYLYSQSKDFKKNIKSQLGAKSTLFNAGTGTNFIYKIVRGVFTDEIMVSINKIDGNKKYQDKVSAIISHGCDLQFVSLNGQTLNNNLTIVDSALPKIFAEIVRLYYCERKRKIKDLIPLLCTINPMDYDKSEGHKFYNYKVKKLLSEMALGMVSSSVWNGVIQATGGFLVVKRNGDILSYHIYDRNHFEDYLYNNTEVDTPSSGRHKFGEVSKVGNEYFINLGFQIRFV